MAAPVHQVPVPPADVVGNAFVHQYYLILHQSPQLVHRFYHDVSKLGRPEQDGVMITTTTMQAINDKILSLGYGGLRAEISTVDSQESHNGGVLVLVTGYLTGIDNVRHKFTQSFFLAPQEKGYFVLNDVFRYVDDINHQNGKQDPVNNIEAPLSPEQDPSPIQENLISEQAKCLSEEANGEEVYNPSENGDDSVEEEETLVPETVDEIPEDSQMAADSQTAAESSTKVEELTKKSYASIVKVMKENNARLSTHTPSPLRSAQKSQEQVIATVPPPPPPPAPVSETPVSSSNATENGKAQEVEAEGPSIYVKGLPLDASPFLLESEFKKFGSIRPGGIQVRCQRGFCFGFVEFEVASAVQGAIEASPIMINGCRVVVEEKRSTSRGNNRRRFSSGTGSGYRNEGGRGRGNFGGSKVYGRGDFGNRAEFGNRNGSRGFSNHGNDGYQRADKRANNGGRVGGLAVNATAKTLPPRVSATA